MKKTAILSLVLSFVHVYSISLDPKDNSEVKNFLIETSQSLQTDYASLAKHFNHLQSNDQIIQRLQKPFESKPWSQYRKLVVSNKRINKGVKFYQKYRTEIKESTQKYGIPQHVILGIIGIESDFMDNLGQYKALDALATLSFAQKSRQAFFKSELAALLKMEKEFHFNIDKLPSSYAGALGMIQFMPSSYLEYAVSNDEYLSSDIFRSIPDSVMSIGNFLSKKCHWHKNSAIAAHWHPSAAHQMSNMMPGTHHLRELKDLGISFPSKYKVSNEMVILEGEKQKEFWFLYPNVKSFKCYNNSLQYVLATHLLGKAIVMKDHELQG